MTGGRAVRSIRIAVIGAAGRTGRCLIAAAATRGHEISALARHPDSIAGLPAVVNLVAGDGRDPAAVAQVIRGADAVVSAINGSNHRGTTQLTDVTRTVLAAMTASYTGSSATPTPTRPAWKNSSPRHAWPGP
mgnify:CR=1 FL=1